MISNSKKFRQFEKRYLKNQKTDISENFRIVEALLAEACALGVFPLKNPLEGLEVDLKIARVVNNVSKTP